MSIPVICGHTEHMKWRAYGREIEIASGYPSNNVYRGINHEKIYIQVAYLLNSEKTIEREFGNLMRINDNFPKMVLSMDEYWAKSRQGITRKNIIDFLNED